MPKGSSPAAVGEHLGARGGLLDRRPKLPCFVIAWPPAPMRREEHANASGASRVENLDHVRDAPIRFHNLAHAGPERAAIRDEVVIRIDDQEASAVQCERHVRSPPGVAIAQQAAEGHFRVGDPISERCATVPATEDVSAHRAVTSRRDSACSGATANPAWRQPSSPPATGWTFL